MSEQWKVIADWPDYEVSTDGRVRRATPGHCTHPGKILSPDFSQRYASVCLRGSYPIRKTRQIHRLVAEAFLGSGEGLQVNHKNGEKHDNRLENLEYVTLQENHRHSARMGLHRHGPTHPNAKLTTEQVAEARQLYDGEKWNHTSLAQRYGVSVPALRAIIRGETRARG